MAYYTICYTVYLKIYSQYGVLQGVAYYLQINELSQCTMFWYSMVWYGIVWYSMVWYGFMVSHWYGIVVWYAIGKVWYDMEQVLAAHKGQ